MRDDGVIGNIGRQDWMEPAEERLQKLVHKAFEFSGGRHAKNFLHSTWLGEPLHVILTDVPIGAWTAAIVFDALDSMSSRRPHSFAIALPPIRQSLSDWLAQSARRQPG